MELTATPTAQGHSSWIFKPWLELHFLQEMQSEWREAQSEGPQVLVSPQPLSRASDFACYFSVNWCRMSFCSSGILSESVSTQNPKLISEYHTPWKSHFKHQAELNAKNGLILPPPPVSPSWKWSRVKHETPCGTALGTPNIQAAPLVVTGIWEDTVPLLEIT